MSLSGADWRGVQIIRSLRETQQVFPFLFCCDIPEVGEKRYPHVYVMEEKEKPLIIKF
jgi:hypothetical protein